MTVYEQILHETLLEKYPGECVEMGENWELIAKIFYDLGYEEAKNEHQKTDQVR